MGVLQNFQKFRVRVWKCYRTSRSSGYCGTGIQNFQKFRSGTKHAVPILRPRTYRTSRISRYGMKVLQNFQKFRVLWHRRTEVPGRYKHAVPVPRVFVAPAYRTSRSSGYGYECPTEGPKVLCRVIPAVNALVMVFRVRYGHHENRKFGYGYECRTELTDVPGTNRVVQNSQKSRVRVLPG